MNAWRLISSPSWLHSITTASTLCSSAAMPLVYMASCLQPATSISCIAARRPTVQRLCRALEAFGAPPTALDPKSLLTPDMVTMFGLPPFRIDLLGDISGVEFAAVWRGSHVVTLAGTPIRVIGLAELRANKASTGRAKDKSDVRRLPKAL